MIVVWGRQFSSFTVRYENGLIALCSFSLVDNEQQVMLDECSEVHRRDASVQD
jgi:hypothetical protein